MTLLEVNASAFTGFSPRIVDFLQGLADHNSREWFAAHRADYEATYLQAAREFVLAVGERSSELGAGLHAEPKVFGSILTINRDVRFSKDKSPYKTHLDLWFW